MSGDTNPEAQHHIPADLTPQQHCCQNLATCTGRPCMFNPYRTNVENRVSS